MNPAYQLDRTKLRAIATATQRAGVWNCPTLAHWEAQSKSGGTSKEYDRYQRVLRRGVEFSLQITKALYDAGAGLLLGTDEDSEDSGSALLPGFSIHREKEARRRLWHQGRPN